VHIKCPNCAASQEIDEAMQGKVHECAECGRLMRIPAADSRPSAVPAPPPKTSIQTRPQGLLGPAKQLASSEPDDDATAEDAEPALKKRGRRKRRRRKPQESSGDGLFHYFTGVIGTFGWILIGLFLLWVGSVALTLAVPGQWRVPFWVGNGLVVIGNVWIGFVAYRDSHVFGMLCFFTFLFTYVYIVMNPSETWQPAVLVGLGFLFIISGWVLA
jgi:hypothetical protein